MLEFLASIPKVEDAEMLSRKSPLLGWLSSYIWKERKSLEEHCVTVLESGSVEPEVQKAAIRVLALTGNPKLGALCDDLSGKAESPIRGFATLAPLLSPSLVDVERYEARVLEPTGPVACRVGLLRILAASGADLDHWYERLRDMEGGMGPARVSDPLWLALACEYPFRGAIPILETHLLSSDKGQFVLSVGAVSSLGTLPFPEATAMLKGAISHPNGAVRAAGALGLQEKRSQSALAKLSQQLCSEDDRLVRSLIAAAIAASCPVGVRNLEVPYERSEGIMRWQCIVAARTRDESFASDLVEIATDGALNWQVRRAAIGAAGYLPFEAALTYIIPSLRAGSTLDIDDHSGLFAHSFVSWLLNEERDHLVGRFAASREAFVRSVGAVFDDSAKELLDRDNVPAGAAVGEWAYAQLSAAGWPNDPSAPEVVINELKTPLLFSAGLRSLRRLGRRDLIEAEIVHARKVWSVIRCIMECGRIGEPGGADFKRIRGLVERAEVRKALADRQDYGGDRRYASQTWTGADCTWGSERAFGYAFELRGSCTSS